MIEEKRRKNMSFRMNHNLQKFSRKEHYLIQFFSSELRLVESLDGICDALLNYNVHKERKDSTRFAKGMSTTFKTLHGLVEKGVKVDLGIPYELWDKPSAEVTQMKTQVNTILLRHCFQFDE